MRCVLSCWVVLYSVSVHIDICVCIDIAIGICRGVGMLFYGIVCLLHCVALFFSVLYCVLLYRILFILCCVVLHCVCIGIGIFICLCLGISIGIGIAKGMQWYVIPFLFSCIVLPCVLLFRSVV